MMKGMSRSLIISMKTHLTNPEPLQLISAINLIFKSPENCPFNMRYTIVKDGTPQKINVVDGRLDNLQILSYLSNIDHSKTDIDIDAILKGFTNSWGCNTHPKHS